VVGRSFFDWARSGQKVEPNAAPDQGGIPAFGYYGSLAAEAGELCRSVPFARLSRQCIHCETYREATVFREQLQPTEPEAVTPTSARKRHQGFSQKPFLFREAQRGLPRHGVLGLIVFPDRRHGNQSAGLPSKL